MAFHADHFIFDGVPSEYYNLMIYYLDDNTSVREENLGTNVDIIEDRINRRISPLHYGVTKKEPLKFQLTFGSMEYLDRHDLDAISGWLTGHNDYKVLEIVQPDMVHIRYKCILNNMRSKSINGIPIAFVCDVICDSPYGYSHPTNFTYNIDNTLNVSFFNKSSVNAYYYPRLKIIPSSGTSEVTIVNQNDQNRMFKLSALASSSELIIDIDNLNQIITSNTTDNLYDNFNNKFFRLVKGVNNLVISGKCTVTITCEFPMAIGG